MKKYWLLVFIVLLCALLITYQGNRGISKDPHPNMSHLENILFATSENPVISPSGLYKMVIEPGYGGNVYNNCFVIYAINSEEPIFTCTKKYRTRDRLYFYWDVEDNICVYSGDIGHTMWEKTGTEWIKHDGDSPNKPTLPIEDYIPHYGL